MANKIDKHKVKHDNINCMIILLWISVIALFIIALVFRAEIDNLKEENEFPIKGNEFIDFNVVCEGNGVKAAANYSMNDYELYKKIIKIYDTKNCDTKFAEGGLNE